MHKNNLFKVGRDNKNVCAAHFTLLHRVHTFDVRRKL